MGNRLSKIYTRTGDDGSTGLGDGTRVAKDSARVGAYGTVDELNSSIGMVLAQDIPAAVRETLTQVQHDLFDLGGELCIPGMAMVHDADVERLEVTLDGFNADLPALKDFILPGGGIAAACCHVARTVCRRAERERSSLFHGPKACAPKPSAISIDCPTCCSCSRGCSHARPGMAKCSGSTSGASHRSRRLGYRRWPSSSAMASSANRRGAARFHRWPMLSLAKP